MNLSGREICSGVKDRKLAESTKNKLPANGVPEQFEYRYNLKAPNTSKDLLRVDSREYQKNDTVTREGQTFFLIDRRSIKEIKDLFLDRQLRQWEGEMPATRNKISAGKGWK